MMKLCKQVYFTEICVNFMSFWKFYEIPRILMTSSHEKLLKMQKVMQVTSFFKFPSTHLLHFSLITSADFHYHKFSFSFEKIEKSYLVFDVGVGNPERR